MEIIVVVLVIAVVLALFAFQIKFIGIVWGANRDLWKDLPPWMARLILVLAVVAGIIGAFLGWTTRR
jgi:protein-S-isoprenylcysteine O-methyltransferase Ste14